MKASSFNLPEIDRREFMLWVFRKRRRLKVVGPSMFPLLKPGDEILYDEQAYRNASPEIGDIVVAWHPSRERFKIIKRVSAVLPSGEVNLHGENPFESTDFNRVPLSTIVGKVTCMFLAAEEKPKTNSR